MWIIILILVSIAVFLIYKEYQNDNLFKTVTHKGRGTWSERDLILRLLKNGFSPDRIFHDLYVQKADGSYSQVDVVILTDKGIIVVEVKHLSGWIFGKGTQSKWVQVLAYGEQKYSFYNPIFQNENHIKCIKNRISHAYSIPFYSLIVFYGDCVLKNLSQIPNRIHITKSNDAISVIENIIESGSEIIYSNIAALEAIFIESVNNGEDRDIRQKHIENINRKWNSPDF